MNTRTVEAFVLNNSKQCDAYFAFSKEVSRDLIINYFHVPPGVDLLGKWIRVVIRDNSACQKVAIINDIFECRVVDGISEIKVQAEYDGRFENRYEVFKHGYFGYIFDTNRIVKNVERGPLYIFWITRYHEKGYSFRWRISHIENNSLRTVEAIVHSYSLDNDGYYAWTKSEPRSKICVNSAMCPPDLNLIGRWITVDIDSNNRVKNTITVIDGVYETRMRYGSTEILIDFDTGHEPGMFFNHYFGNISDPRNMISRAETDAWYRGWIIFYIKRGVDTRWRISKDQSIEGPFFNHVVKNQRRSSYDGYEKCNNRNPRSFSPTIINHYDNDYKERKSTHSPFAQQRNASSHSNDFDYGGSPRDTSNNDPSSSNKNDFYKSYPVSGYQQVFEIKNSEDYSQKHLEDRRPRVDDHQNRNHLNNHNNDFSNPNSFNYEFNAPHSDRYSDEDSKKTIIHESEVTESRLNDTVVSDSEYYTCSDEKTNKVNRQKTESNRRDSHHKVSESSSVNRRSNKNQDVLDVKTKIVDEMDTNFIHSNESELAPNHTKSQDEKEVKRLKLEILRVSQLVKSLTKDFPVSDQMRMFSLEEYEELMELIDS